MNPETDSHTLVIVAAYLLTFLVVMVMLASILADYRGLKTALARMEKNRADGDGTWKS